MGTDETQIGNSEGGQEGGGAALRFSSPGFFDKGPFPSPICVSSVSIGGQAKIS
jgi:hypothetical protein